MQKPLGLPTLLALGINGVVGVGIFFVVPTVAKNLPGFWGLSAYALVVAACLPIALVYAKLGSRFPEDGGPYLFARSAFGDDAAFGIGWIAYISAIFSTAAVLVGFVEAVSPHLGIVTSSGRSLLGAGLVTALALLLSLGLKIAAWAWTTVTIAKLTPLALLLFAAVFFGAKPGVVEAAPSEIPSAFSIAGFLGAAMAVLFSLQGFEVVPLPAGQVEKSSRAVPIATIATLVFAGLLYMALHAACLIALPDLASRTMPIADAAAVFGGEWLGRLVTAGVSVSSFGIVVGMMAMTPRYLAVLGQDLGSALSFSQRGVPRRAFAISWALIVAIVVTNFYRGSISNLFALSTISVLLQYIVTAAALMVLARRRERGLSPRDGWPVPLVFLAGIWLGMGAELIELGLVALVVGGGFLLRAGVRGQRLREAARP